MNKNPNTDAVEAIASAASKTSAEKDATARDLALLLIKYRQLVRGIDDIIDVQKLYPGYEKLEKEGDALLDNYNKT